MWTHFSYEDGSNPYISKTEKETKKIIEKYKDRCQKIKDNFYLIKR